jgi:hypothetical protein
MNGSAEICFDEKQESITVVGPSTALGKLDLCLSPMSRVDTAEFLKHLGQAFHLVESGSLHICLLDPNQGKHLILDGMTATACRYFCVGISTTVSRGPKFPCLFCEKLMDFPCMFS